MRLLAGLIVVTIFRSSYADAQPIEPDFVGLLRSSRIVIFAHEANLKSEIFDAFDTYGLEVEFVTELRNLAANPTLLDVLIVDYDAARESGSAFAAYHYNRGATLAFLDVPLTRVRSLTGNRCIGRNASNFDRLKADGPYFVVVTHVATGDSTRDIALAVKTRRSTCGEQVAYGIGSYVSVHEGFSIANYGTANGQITFEWVIAELGKHRLRANAALMR